MTEIAGSPWQQLFERLVGELDQPASPDWEAQTNTLNPRVYYDEGRFEAEHEQLFRRLPLCLGHVDQLAEPGAVLAVDLCGTPLLIARGADRVLRVFSRRLPSPRRTAHSRTRRSVPATDLRLPLPCLDLSP